MTDTAAAQDAPPEPDSGIDAVESVDNAPTGTGDWSVYIVRCADGSLYTGIARDCTARLSEHNAGIGAKYTRSRRPVSLVYRESADSRASAQRREHEIKRLPRTAKVQLIARRPGAD